MNNRILITGSTGFLGSEVVRQFQAQGAALRTTGRASNADLPDYHASDLSEEAGLADLVKDVGCVVHVAGLAHQFGPAANDPDRYFRVNRDATVALAKAAAAAGATHFVFVSSMSVYGSGSDSNPDEKAGLRPEGPYAESKSEAEDLLARFAAETAMRITILRPATLYGEGDPGNVARLMRAIDRRRFFWIGRGSNKKTLIHRDDVAAAIVAASSRSEGAQVEIFNIAAPPVRMREVVDALGRELGKEVFPIGFPGALVRLPLRIAASAGPLRPRAARWLGTIDKWLSDDTIDGGKLARTFGISPGVSLEDGIRREVNWYRESADKT